jgi:hypothetical protein
MNENKKQNQIVIALLIVIAIVTTIVAVSRTGSCPHASAQNTPALQPKTPVVRLPGPSPDFGPEEVVRLVVDALQHNADSYNDEGIRVTFNFASPKNKRMTGPLPIFIQMVKSPHYRLMLGHQHAEFGTLETNGSTVRQRVTLHDGENRGTTFIFVLSCQSKGPHAGCWMTDAVLLDSDNQKPWI